MALYWSALPAATIKGPERRGWHELSAHTRKQILILGWSVPQSSGATKEHLRLHSTGSACGLVGNGFYSRFWSSRHTPTPITHKGQGTERWPERGCKRGIWKEMNSHLKKEFESCRRRAGNSRAPGGRRVAGAEAEGPRGKDGSEMNTHYDHYKYHPKEQTLGSLLNQQQRPSHVSTFISQTAGLFHFTHCTHLNLWDVYVARTHVGDH